MRFPNRLLPYIITTLLAGCAYLLTVVAWDYFLRSSDPEHKGIHYHLLKQISWLTAPVLGGLACGLIASIFRRAHPAVVSALSSALLVLAFSLVSITSGGRLVWLNPLEFVSKAYWQCFAVLLPASAMATAWLVSRLRARRARRRA